MATDKVITLEACGGAYQMELQRILRMVPDRDKDDVALQRLLAFRLRLDGEGATREYLMRKIRDMIQCSYRGRLYEFLKNDQLSRGCPAIEPPSSPPDIA